MTYADEERQALNPEALAYVKLFEGKISKGADVEDLMANALAMQNRAEQKGEYERANALRDAINFLEASHGVDSIAIAGDLAVADNKDVTGYGILASYADSGIALRANHRNAAKKRELDVVPRVQAIIDKVAGLYGLTSDDLIGVDLPRINREAQNLALYIASETTSLTWPGLGTLFLGGRNNLDSYTPLVIARCNTVTKHIDEPHIREKLESVMSELGLEKVERRPAIGKSKLR